MGLNVHEADWNMSGGSDGYTIFCIPRPATMSSVAAFGNAPSTKRLHHSRVATSHRWSCQAHCSERHLTVKSWPKHELLIMWRQFFFLELIALFIQIQAAAHCLVSIIMLMTSQLLVPHCIIPLSRSSLEILLIGARAQSGGDLEPLSRRKYISWFCGNQRWVPGSGRFYE